MLPAADCNSLETGQKRLQLIFKYRQNKIQFKNKSNSEVSSSMFRIVTYKLSFTFLEFHYIMPKRNYISRAQFNNLYASLNTHDLSNIIKLFYRVPRHSVNSVAENSSLRSVYASVYHWMVFYNAGVCHEFSTRLLVLPKKEKTCAAEKINNSSKSFPLFFARALYGSNTASSSYVSSC